MEKKEYYFEEEFFEVLKKADKEAKRLELSFIPNILIVKLLYKNDFSVIRNLINFIGLPSDYVEKNFDKLIKIFTEESTNDNITGIDTSVLDLAAYFSFSNLNGIDEIDYLLGLVVSKDKYFTMFFEIFHKNMEDVEVYLKGKKSVFYEVLNENNSGYLS